MNISKGKEILRTRIKFGRKFPKNFMEKGSTSLSSLICRFLRHGMSQKNIDVQFLLKKCYHIQPTLTSINFIDHTRECMFLPSLKPDGEDKFSILTSKSQLIYRSSNSILILSHFSNGLKPK